MARLPIYTQQTTVGAPEVSMGAAAAPFGALADVAGGLAEIGAQMKRREDVIDRVQKLGTFDTEAVQMLEAMQSTGDIATKETVDSFYQGLRARADELIESHGGTSQSRAELQAQLYNQVNQYHRSAVGEQIKAQRMMIANNVATKANELSITATFAPGEVINALSEFDDHLLKIADSMSPQELEEYRKNGRAQIAAGSINGFLQQGDLVNARKLLKDTQIGTMLPPKEAQRVALTITAEEGRRAQAAAATTNNVVAWQSFLGRELSPQEAQRAAQVNPFAKNKSIPEQIVELEMITQQPATQTDIDRLLKRSQEEPGFGSSLQGRALDYVNSNAEAFATGLMSPEEGRRFVASFNAVYGPKIVRSPITGFITEERPSVPEFIQNAFESGSQYYGGISSTSVTTPMRGTATVGQVTPVTPPSAETTETIETSEAMPQPSGPPSINPEDTIYGSASYITGPSSMIARKIKEAPFGIGEAVDIDERYIRSKEKAKFVQERIVGALRPESKIADQYRQELKALVDIDPKLWDNPEALQVRTAEIDKELRKRAQDLDKIATGVVPGSIQDQKDALDIANAIRSVLPDLGVPQIKVNTREEALKLPSGTVFLFGNDPAPKVRK